MTERPREITGPTQLPDVHRRETEAAQKEERRLFWAELCCLLLVAGFVVVRHLWLA